MNHRMTLLLACLATTAAISTAGADTYGPDAFGHTAADNLGADALHLGFTFTDIADDQTIMMGAAECCVTGDDGTVTCTPGVSEPDCTTMGGEYEPAAPLDDELTAGMTDFEFPMYGLMYGGGASGYPIYVSSNGFISFDADFNADLSNDCPLPQPVFGGGARIYALHDDLVSFVYVFEQDAEAPDPVYPHPSGVDRGALIVQWSADHFPAFDFEPFMFQAVLYETGEIALLYPGGNPEQGLGSTTGLQNHDGTDGLTIQCNEAGSIPNLPDPGYTLFIKPYTDCNNNFIDDAEDVAPGGGSQDLNGNGIPDECDDCNGNGTPDVLEILNDPSLDCNGNLLLDSCEVADGLVEDCNGNGTPDACEIDVNSPAPGGPFFCTGRCNPDCNDNGIPDDCEEDCNDNGIPDDCDTEPENDPATAEEQDDCGDALLLDPQYTYFGNTFGATNDGDPQCSFFFGMNEVWYRYRPAWTGSLFVHAGSIADLGVLPTSLVIALHDGCPGTAGNQIACSAIAPCSIFVDVTKGVDYWLRVSGRNFDPATFKINLVGPATATNLNDYNRNRIPDECECLSDVNSDGVVDTVDFALVMAAYGPCPGCPEDVDGSGVVNDLDAQEVLMNLGPCPFP